MTTILECDGCGETTKRVQRIRHVVISITNPDAQNIPLFEGHLCSVCERTVQKNADPRKWVRPAAEAAP